MKKYLLFISFFYTLFGLAQNTSLEKNNGRSYISDENFTHVLVEVNYNLLADINSDTKNSVNSWRLHANNTECTVCDNVFAEINPIWNTNSKFPLEISMRYFFRPSTNSVDINYTLNIINSHVGNTFIAKLTEVNSGIERIIGTLNKAQNKLFNEKIKVVPGRSYYIDIIANYASLTNKTIFQFDTLKITENILTGTMVFNPTQN